MSIIVVSRSGPPEATLCPALFCDVCGDPCYDVENGDWSERCNAVWFERRREDGLFEQSPVWFEHKGCARRTDHPLRKRYPQEEHWSLLWDEASRFFGQLLHNYTHPFYEDPDVRRDKAEYVAPFPLNWRVGYFERAKA